VADLRLVTCVRPRSVYQVFRYVEGGKLMLTRTKRGIIGVWRLVLSPDGAVERPVRVTDAYEQRECLERIIRAGYDLPAICAELKRRCERCLS
jgi:hypothetical protein